jgi:hypothetical protein
VSDAVEDLELLAENRLVTGRYKTFRPSDGVPIRTTVGAPKYWKGGPLIQLREITPYGVFGEVLDHAAAEEAYRQRLDRYAEIIVAGLSEVARQHPGQALCLLCFEDVHAGQVCHRRWFADWFEERYGIEVPELGAPGHQMPLPW